MESLYEEFSCMDGRSQEIARVVVQKISSALSMMGSFHILNTVYAKYRSNRSSVDPYQRIMVGFAIFDVLFSFFYWFMGSWMTPRETGWWGAVGNVRTCSVQGFFFSLIYGSVVSDYSVAHQNFTRYRFFMSPNLPCNADVPNDAFIANATFGDVHVDAKPI